MNQVKPYLLWIVAGVVSLALVILMVVYTPKVEDQGEFKDAYVIKTLLDDESVKLQKLAKRARNGDPNSIWDPQSDEHIRKLTSDYLLTTKWIDVIKPDVEKYSRQRGEIRDDLQARSQVINVPVASTVDKQPWYVEYERLTGELVTKMREAGCLDSTTRAPNSSAPPGAMPPGMPPGAMPPGVPPGAGIPQGGGVPFPANAQGGAIPGAQGGAVLPGGQGGAMPPGLAAMPPGAPPGAGAMPPGAGAMPGAMPPGLGAMPPGAGAIPTGAGAITYGNDEKDQDPVTGKKIRDRLGLFTKTGGEYPAPSEHPKLTSQFRIAERLCAAIRESTAETLGNPLIEGSSGVRMPATVYKWDWSTTADVLTGSFVKQAKPWRLIVTLRGTESALMAALAQFESLDRPVMVVLGSTLKRIESQSGPQHPLRGSHGEPTAAVAELAVEMLVLDFTIMPDPNQPIAPVVDASQPPAKAPPRPKKAVPVKEVDPDE